MTSSAAATSQKVKPSRMAVAHAQPLIRHDFTTRFPSLSTGARVIGRAEAIVADGYRCAHCSTPRRKQRALSVYARQRCFFGGVFFSFCKLSQCFKNALSGVYGCPEKPRSLLFSSTTSHAE